MWYATIINMDYCKECIHFNNNENIKQCNKFSFLDFSKSNVKIYFKIDKCLERTK